MTIKEIYEQFGKDTRANADSSKLAFFLWNEQQRLPELYQKLGEFVYCRYQSGEMNDPSLDILCNEIDEIENAGAALRADYETLRSGGKLEQKPEDEPEPEIIQEPAAVEVVCEPEDEQIPASEPICNDDIPETEPEPEPIAAEPYVEPELSESDNDPDFWPPYVQETEPASSPVEPEPVNNGFNLSDPDEHTFGVNPGWHNAIKNPVPNPVQNVYNGKKRCGNCGAELMADAKFCLVCGAKVTTDEQPKPEQHRKKKFCANCGTQLVGDAPFCPRCGAKR